jgi:hypothetical protein
MTFGPGAAPVVKIIETGAQPQWAPVVEIIEADPV